MFASYPRGAQQIDTRIVRRPSLPLEGAARQLQDLINAGQIAERQLDFAINLVSAATRGRVSPKQQYWTEKLVADAAAAKPELRTEQLGETVRGVFDLFTRATSSGLKHPKIHLIASDGTGVRFYRAGERSKYTGQVMVVEYAGAGLSRYFGRIDEQGRLVEAPKMTEAVRTLVLAFAENPAYVASFHGKQTGNCCFCNRVLETDESVSVGYGPICAEKFGLPWGKRAAAAAQAEPEMRDLDQDPEAWGSK